MIDLSYQKPNVQDEDTPVGIQILALLPGVILFWILLGCLP